MVIQSQALGLATEDLNAAIDEASTALKQLNLAVSAEVRLSPDAAIGFGKVADEWCLYVRERDGVAKPLRSASRQKRVDACALLGDVLKALLEASDAQIGSVQIAAKQAEDFAERVRILAIRSALS